MKTNSLVLFSDGTECDYCGNLVLTTLGLDYKANDRMFCCKECSDDYEELEE